MTIKQQGGIFGRNPTFNNVTVDGTLTADGSLTGNVVNAAGADGAAAINIKEGANVRGTIGHTSDDLFIANASCGLYFDNTNDRLLPYNFTTNSLSIGTIALGQATYRFKELYLSENVYVGAGYGIDFSATSGTGTSELLDDYEEGTWTPTWEGNTTPGTITASTLVATYTKVGRIVHVQVYAIFNVAVAGSGYLKVTLPFSKASNTMFCGPVNTYNIDLPAGAVDSTVVPTSSVPSNNIALFSVSTDNGATGLIDASGISTSDEILFSFSYIAA